MITTHRSPKTNQRNPEIAGVLRERLHFEGVSTYTPKKQFAADDGVEAVISEIDAILYDEIGVKQKAEFLLKHKQILIGAEEKIEFESHLAMRLKEYPAVGKAYRELIAS